MRKFFRLFIRRLSTDRLNNYSAQMAYTLLLAMFPILLFFGYIVSQFNISVDPLIRFLQGNTSVQVFSKLNQFANAQVHKANITFLSPIFIISLVSISFGLRPLIGALNHIYRIEETRTWIRNFFISLIGTVFLMFALIGAVILFLYNIAFQEVILSMFPVMNHFHIVLNVISCLVLLSSIFLFLIFAFTVMPAKRYRMRVNVRAAFNSTVLLFIFSVCFLYYVTYLNRTYNIFYGSLGSIIAMITWFYFSSIAILIGLELEIIHEQIRHKREIPEIENSFLNWIDKGVRLLWRKR
ncbi:MAG: YihY/virulence factor BrkB family protein [Culicoidibacterales bacterium]